METDYQSTIGAGQREDSSDGETMHDGCDEDEIPPAELSLESSVHDFELGIEEGWSSLAQDVKHRYSSSDQVASCRSLWGEGSCPSFEDRVSLSSQDIALFQTGMSSDSMVVVGSVADVDGKSHHLPLCHFFSRIYFPHSASATVNASVLGLSSASRLPRLMLGKKSVIPCPYKSSPPADESRSSSSQAPLVHPLSSARLSPIITMSQEVTPQGGIQPISLPSPSSESSFELPPLLRIRSQPIDIRPPLPGRLQLNNPTNVELSSSFYHLSDCESAILEPRSPPQGTTIPSCGCFVAAANASE